MLKIRELNGNGDFRSEECITYLEESDIVVTNPPFTLIKDFVSLMEEFEKDFIFIGPKNLLTYNIGQMLIKKGRLFLGYGRGTDHLFFISPEGEKTSRVCSVVLVFLRSKNTPKFDRIILA